MDPLVALAAVGAVVLAAVTAGLLLRRRDGRVRTARGDVTPDTLGIPGVALGERATLVQFSTELCTKCPAARRVLGAAAAEREGVVHLDIDLTHRPDVARRFGVLQTPTILFVDAHGTARTRIGGAPRPADIARELDRILEDSRV